MVMNPIIMPESRCECSANIEMSCSQPSGLIEPLDNGQSGNAIPAPMLVVKAPRVTSRNTHTLPIAAKNARAGLWVMLRRDSKPWAMS